MLVADIQAQGICAGKQSVADYLIEKHGFSSLHIANVPSLMPTEKAVLQQDVSCDNPDEKGNKALFHNAESLLNFVTERWKERWVTTAICDENALRHLARRPFFILVSVDAPVSLRWQRFKLR